MKDKNYLYIIGACVFTYAFYLIVEYIYTGGQMGVPLDDSWIHFRFAENFASGYFFHYNIGQPVAGSTSPLWVVLLAAFSFISGNYIFNSVFLSAIFHLLSCLFIYRLSLEIFSRKASTKNEAGTISLFVAIVTVLTGRLAWAGLSGMETTLFTFLCIGGIYAHIINLEQKRFTLIPSLLFALASVTRPESFLLFGLYVIDVVVNSIKEKNFNKVILPLSFGIVIFIIITTPYFVFSHFTSEHFLPTTFRGQGGRLNDFIPSKKYLEVTFTFLFRDNFIITLLYLAGIVYYIINLRKKFFYEFRSVNLIFLWIFLLPAISSLFVPNWRHHGRYIMPLLPLINFAAFYIYFSLSDKLKNRKLKDFALSRLALILIVGFSLLYYAVYARAIGMNTQNINDQQVTLAHWVDQNVGKDETIALNDIGAITFITKNKVVDMAGLVSPEILRYRTYQWQDNLDSTYYLLKNNNVSYVIIYDTWFEPFLAKYGDRFEYVRSAILEDNTICGGEEMKVYKIHYPESEK